MLTDYGHLTYCTNIHAGESWADHFRALQDNFPAIKRSVSPNQAMGMGLRLSNEASLELEKEASLSAFRQWLTDNDVYVFTMNGFPYGGFHHTKVKDQVHAPDWTTRERVEYTQRLFNILQDLLPAGMDGGISTSPLSYRRWSQSPEQTAQVRGTATLHIVEVLLELIQWKLTTGKTLHLDIEPEPDGLLETGLEFITWFENDLLTAGIPLVTAGFGVSPEVAKDLIRHHLRLCYDVCHFSIGYESAEEVIGQLAEKEIRIGKFQLSAALKSSLEGSSLEKEEIRRAFLKYQEGVYLHQVIARTNEDAFLRYPDLPEALADFDNPLVKEWRAHFHVPLFAKDFGVLSSTQDAVCQALRIQQQQKLTGHLEIETYTWEVLPAGLKLPLQESIIRELQWVLGQLQG